jgi:hypothetical protein
VPADELSARHRAEYLYTNILVGRCEKGQEQTFSWDCIQALGGATNAREAYGNLGEMLNVAAVERSLRRG